MTEARAGGSAWRFLFFLAAIYDGVLGLLFLLVPLRIFAAAEVAPPNHPGYAQFPAALLLVFAVLFVRIARDPAGNRSLIPYGMLLKISYCGVVFWHWAVSGLPWIWKPFAVADLAFLLAFAAAWKALAPGEQR